MRQKITFNNTIYTVLDCITLGTTKYIFVIDDKFDFKCLTEHVQNQTIVFDEYSNNSSFLPWELNKTTIINYFMNQIKPLILQTSNISYDNIIRSIKKFIFYVQESDLKYYINDNIPYRLTNQSLDNLNLFLSKTITVEDPNKTISPTVQTSTTPQELTQNQTSTINEKTITTQAPTTPLIIKAEPLISNRPLTFKNKLYTVFYRLNITNTIYVFALEQRQEEIRVFKETNKNETLGYKVVKTSNPDLMTPLDITNKNILVNYFTNRLNQEIPKYNNIKIHYVINSIDKFIFYLKESELKDCIKTNNPLPLKSQSLINLFLFFDQTIKISDQKLVITPLEKINSEIIEQPNKPLETINATPIASSNENLSPSQKEKRRKKFNFYTFILIASILIAAVGGYFLLKWYIDGNKTEKLNEDIQEKVEVEEQEGGEAVNPPEEDGTTDLSDYWKYMQMSLINVDFDELLAINQDTVGWIQVNGTNINYPIVQSGDNDYYLHHAFDGSYNNAGWIFADYRNDLNNLSRNNIIYGHGRLDTTMFGSLKNILTSDWYNNSDNHVVKLSTPTQNTLWQVFSVYAIEAESYYITTDFPTTNQYNQFLTTLKNRSVFSFNADVNTNDKILTLSTCQDNYDHRVVMHAKLIKVENR